LTTITRVETIRSRADGSWLFVKIHTNQPGLFGLGSASDPFRCSVIEEAVKTVAPLLIGRDASRIEDIWQSVYTCCYWRNDSVFSTAQSGIDQALWDLKGKEAGLPIYQLLGGKCRTAVQAYAHASGDSLAQLGDDVARYLEEGYHVVRCQLGAYGGGGFLEGAFDDDTYLEKIPQMFEYLRNRFGLGPKLTHDVHEHLMPQNAVRLSKLLEPYRLYLLEDVLPPEQLPWYRQIRQHCTTPQAVGELFTNPNEFVPLISERLIDFVRLRVSKAGGITNCRKVATLCEWFGVRTAWQEGADNDPVNQMASVHLDLASSSFGVQEENHFEEAELAVFEGVARLEGGYLYANEAPGLGIHLDEKAARSLLDPQLAKRSYFIAEDRRRDGEILRP